MSIHKIAPCLWFDHQAEEAARFYVGIFRNSRIRAIRRYGEAGHEVHRRPAGSVLTVDFELDGQLFTALNGGPLFTFNEAVSLQVYCDTQQEIDRLWEALGEGGDPKAQQCGWLKDKYGVSWQIVPASLREQTGDEQISDKLMNALLKMKKLDMAALERAMAE